METHGVSSVATVTASRRKSRAVGVEVGSEADIARMHLCDYTADRRMCFNVRDKYAVLKRGFPRDTNSIAALYFGIRPGGPGVVIKQVHARCAKRRP